MRGKRLRGAASSFWEVTMHKKIDRRRFISLSAALGAGLVGVLKGGPAFARAGSKGRNIVISTWKHGLPANEVAAKILMSGKNALDAVERGVRVSEADPDVKGVGYGGYPDDTGCVTLDASIMNSQGNAGAVAFLQNIKHPISVARKVMEETDHVLLVGEGALAFAKLQGFKEENLLTDRARKAYLNWKANLSESDNWFPPVSEENHDTIGMIAQDGTGDLAGACTTSGLAWKIHGRVGDSPIIGAGMYVDNEIGGAAATGRGEAAIKIAGSFLVVECMRRGASPQDAIAEALKRVIKANHGDPKFQLAFVALNKKGDFGALSLHKNFQYALYKDGVNKLYDSEYLLQD